MREMTKLFCLTFYTQPNDGYREGFRVGLFRTYDEAKRVELLYRRAVPGFKEYACDSEIAEVPVIGETKEETDCVYRYVGWNENEDLDETDIIESDCYTDVGQAEKACETAQVQFARKAWTLNRCIIGQCNWREGFVRESY